MEKVVSTTHLDLNAVAQCHCKAFPHALATALGRRHVRRMLSWYLSTQSAFLFHVEDEAGRCIGYCGGIVSDGSLDTGSSSGMAQHSFWSAIWGFITHPWVLFHPEVRKKWPLLRKNILMKLGVRRKHFSPAQKQKMAQNPHVGLVVIGVAPEFHGKGYGSMLLKEFERRAVEDYGIYQLGLSVLATNHKAIRAYERNGWVKGKLQGESLQMKKEVAKM